MCPIMWFYSFKKFLEGASIAEVLGKQEYDELCTEIGSKEEVGS